MYGWVSEFVWLIILRLPPRFFNSPNTIAIVLRGAFLFGTPCIQLIFARVESTAHGECIASFFEHPLALSRYRGGEIARSAGRVFAGSFPDADYGQK